MNTAQFISIFNSGGNPLGPFQERVEADGGTVEGLDNMLAKYDASASWQLIPSAVKAGTAYAQVPNTSVGDLTVTRASSGTFTNSAGVVQTAASNVLRTDYRNADGTLSATGRYLLEPQRTNSIRNSSMVGAVAGSPGTIPTNWQVGTSAGLTQTVVGIGTENGLPYIDFRFNGTAVSDTITIWFETVTQIAATNGQTWTNSIYAKLISGTALGFQQAIRELTAAGGTITTGQSSITLTSTLKRFTQTRANIDATCAFVRPGVWASITIGQTYDFTIRIAAPQMELGAYATTWVPTTTAAVTRLADSASKSGVSSLIGQTEGTIYWEGFLSPGADDTFTFNLSAANTVIIGKNLSNQVVGRIIANTAQTSLSTTTTHNGFTKIALAYKSGNSVLYVNGNLASTSSNSYTFSAALSVINLAFGSAVFFGFEKKETNQAALFKTRLTNAQLAQLTTL